MRLASDEATALTERLERESVVRLQAILDHVKDGIVSVDHLGRIESMNRTAERFFGVRQVRCHVGPLDSLIPDIAPQATSPAHSRSWRRAGPNPTTSRRARSWPGTAVAS